MLFYLSALVNAQGIVELLLCIFHLPGQGMGDTDAVSFMLYVGFASPAWTRFSSAGRLSPCIQ
eukprot:4062436-Pyramimonas_sp.AAC.1